MIQTVWNVPKKNSSPSTSSQVELAVRAQKSKKKKIGGNSINKGEIFTMRGEIMIFKEIIFSGEYETPSTDNVHKIIGTKKVRKKTNSNYIALKIVMLTTANKISQFARECWNMRITKYEILLY